MSPKIKVALSLVCAVLLGLAAWSYYSPYLTLKSIREAAEAKDADALSSNVNFPALKENIKGTFAAKLAQEAGSNGGNDPFKAVGALFANAMLEKLIDALVTPEALAKMMQGEQPSEPGRKTAAASAPPSQPASSPTFNLEPSSGYKGYNKFVANVTRSDSPEQPVGFVLTRDGLFSWKLTAIKMPWFDEKKPK